jgi:Mce-associated membrane protein
MEDQQLAEGDLTVEDRDDKAQADTAADTAAEVDSTEKSETTEPESDEPGDPDASDVTDAGDTTGADSVEAATPTPAKKRTGRWAAALVALAVALFVGSAAFAGATVQPYLAQRATVDVKQQVARAAANTITTLWSYNPTNMDTLADRAANYLTGDFGAQYRKFADHMTAPMKQAQITNSTEVTGVAVESLDGPNAVAIVYTNTTATSPLTKEIPSLKYFSYRLNMKLEDGRWKVTRMTTVTSLDLTPHV